MSVGRVRITDHAVDRFLKRVLPGVDRAEVRSMLEDAFDEGALLREQTHAGHQVWKVSGCWSVGFQDTDWTCRLVTKRDGDGLIHAVTVLPLQLAEDTDATILQEWREEQEARLVQAKIEKEALTKRVAAATAEVQTVAMERDAVVARAKRTGGRVGADRARAGVRVMASKAHQALVDRGRELELKRLEIREIEADRVVIRDALGDRERVARLQDRDRILWDALRHTVGFLLDHAVDHPEDAGKVMEQVRQLDPDLLVDRR